MARIPEEEIERLKRGVSLILAQRVGRISLGYVRFMRTMRLR